MVFKRLLSFESCLPMSIFNFLLTSTFTSSPSPSYLKSHHSLTSISISTSLFDQVEWKSRLIVMSPLLTLPCWQLRIVLSVARKSESLPCTSSYVPLVVPEQRPQVQVPRVPYVPWPELEWGSVVSVSERGGQELEAVWKEITLWGISAAIQVRKRDIRYQNCSYGFSDRWKERGGLRRLERWSNPSEIQEVLSKTQVSMWIWKIT